MKPMPELELNPDIIKVKVGIREINTVSLYPLPASFQVKLIKNISQLLVDIFSFSAKEMSDKEIGKKLTVAIVDALEKNLPEVLKFSFDTKELSDIGISNNEELLDTISTKQLDTILSHVYKTNYEGIVGKITGRLLKDQEGGNLLRKIQGTASLMTESSPSSSDTTEGTDSEISKPPIIKEG
jgi:hypothetical protein